MVVDIDPAAGAQIVHIGRDRERNALYFADWRSPLPASLSSSYGSSVMDWLSEYRGGWQELFSNAGAECVVAGVPLPFHGEVSRATWEVLTASEAQATLRTAARLPLILERSMELEPHTAVLRIEERVTNESDEDVAFLWGHHPAFFLNSGALIDLPAGKVHADHGLDASDVDLEPGGVGRWPMGVGRQGESVDLRSIPDGPVQRLCYLSDVTQGWAAMRDSDRGVGIALAWDSATFPHLWFWQQIAGRGFPWFGRARITAIEPVCAWPADGLAAAVERGQALSIGPRESLSTWLSLALFVPGNRAVVRVNRDGTIEEE